MAATVPVVQKAPVYREPTWVPVIPGVDGVTALSKLKTVALNSRADIDEHATYAEFDAYTWEATAKYAKTVVTVFQETDGSLFVEFQHRDGESLLFQKFVYDMIKKGNNPVNPDLRLFDYPDRPIPRGIEPLPLPDGAEEKYDSTCTKILTDMAESPYQHTRAAGGQALMIVVDRIVDNARTVPALKSILEPAITLHDDGSLPTRMIDAECATVFASLISKLCQQSAEFRCRADVLQMLGESCIILSRHGAMWIEAKRRIADALLTLSTTPTKTVRELGLKAAWFIDIAKAEHVGGEGRLQSLLFLSQRLRSLEVSKE